MIEIDKYGNINGAFWVGVIFFVAGLESSSASYRLKSYWLLRNTAVPRFSNVFTKNFILMLSIFIILLSLFILYFYSSPVLLKINRVAFWSSHVPGLISKYPSLVGQTFFFAAFYYRITKKNNSNMILPVTIIILYIAFTLIISGEKFSTFIIYLFMWSVLIAGIEQRVRLSWKDFIFAVAVLGSLLLVVLISYLRADKEAAFILARIALQGQLLWSVCNESLSVLIGGADWKIYFGGSEFKDGIDFITFRYLPSSLYYAYLNSGSNLSGFLPALPILAFGLPIALFIHIIVSLFFGFFQLNLIGHIRNKNVFYSFILFKMYFALILVWYASKFLVIPGLILAMIIAGIYRFLPTQAIIKRESYLPRT